MYMHSYLEMIYFLSLWWRHFDKRLNISQNYSHIRLWSLSAETPGTWWAHRCSVSNSSRWPGCGEHPRRWPWQWPIARRAGADRLWRNKESNTVRCVFNDIHVLGVQALNSARCRGICRENREVKFIFSDVFSLFNLDDEFLNEFWWLRAHQAKKKKNRKKENHLQQQFPSFSPVASHCL